MTFSEIKTEVFRRLEESLSSPVYFETTEVEASINEGYEEISEVSEWYETSSTITLQADTIYYWMRPNSVLTPTQAYNPDFSGWIEWSYVEELDRNRTRWEKTGGTPRWMFTRGAEWLGFYPVPNTDGDTITLYHTAMPTLLSADSDEPGFPQEFHYGLVNYALYDLLLQEAETKKAMDFWGEFIGTQEELKRFAANRTPDRRRRMSGGENAFLRSR